MRRAAIGLGLMAAALFTHTAHALDVCALSGDHQAQTVVHAVGTFASDSPQHDFLTDWIYLSHPDAWTCLHKTANPKTTTEVILKARMSPASPVDSDFIVDGENYGVYKSDTATDSRIGFIVNRRYRIKAIDYDYDWESPWLPVRDNTDNGAHPDGYKHFLALPDGTSYTVSFESKIRLVKRPANGHKTNNFPRTGEVIEFRAVKWWYWRASGGGLPERYTRIRVWFNRDDKTCTTPSSKTVYLRDVRTSEFSGEGSWAKETGFTLELTNCSSEVKKIKYKLAPVGLTGAPNYHQVALETIPWSLLTPEPGALPLGAGTTATGVHVQVLDGNGNPVKFDRTTMLVAPYTKGSGTASIPLQARYLQTGSTVTPGRVYATMSVLYMYN